MQGSPRAGHSAKNVSDLIYERHQERLPPGRAVLATASLNPPAGGPSGGIQQPLPHGGAQQGGHIQQNSRKADAEAKHAARLASTGTGARAAAMAALRASRRKVAARLPAARTGTHDSASPDAGLNVRSSTSQMGVGSADIARSENGQCTVQQAAGPLIGSAHVPAAQSAVPHQGGAEEADGITASAHSAPAVRVEPWGHVAAKAPLLPLTLPSPPRRGREPFPASPRVRPQDDLALEMGLPPSPRLPTRHQSGAPRLGRGPLCNAASKFIFNSRF